MTKLQIPNILKFEDVIPFSMESGNTNQTGILIDHCESLIKSKSNGICLIVGDQSSMKFFLKKQTLENIIQLYVLSDIFI